MKKLIFLLIFFIFNFSNSQNSIKNDEFRDWENPENFKKFGFKKVSSYSIKLNKKGKIKRDSLLLSEHNYDKSNSVIYGIFSYLIVTSHAGTYLKFYNFKNTYTKDGLILIKENIPISKEKKNKNKYELDTNTELYQYDSLKRKIKETSFEETKRISLYNKDTLSYTKSRNYPMIIEYEYDTKNRIIKQFLTRDSSAYYYKFENQKDFKNSKSCSSCEPKYLDKEWNYDGDKLTKHINYNYKKEVHSNKYYFYNSNNQLIKEIDSTGFYLAKPYKNSILEIIYKDDERIEKKTKFDWFDLKISSNELIKYDLQNRIKSINYESNYLENNDETKYEYLDNSTIITRENKKHQTTFKEVYQFDKRGLLLEKKEYFNNILIELTKYYYE